MDIRGMTPPTMNCWAPHWHDGRPDTLIIVVVNSIGYIDHHEQRPCRTLLGDQFRIRNRHHHSVDLSYCEHCSAPCAILTIHHDNQSRGTLQTADVRRICSLMFCIFFERFDVFFVISAVMLLPVGLLLVVIILWIFSGFMIYHSFGGSSFIAEHPGFLALVILVQTSLLYLGATEVGSGVIVRGVAEMYVGALCW